MKKFFKTTYTIVVLSEDTPATYLSLQELDYAIGSGPCVGEVEDDGGVELTGKQAADALYALGSEPGTFGLDDNGDDEEGEESKSTTPP